MNEFKCVIPILNVKNFAASIVYKHSLPRSPWGRKSQDPPRPEGAVPLALQYPAC